jgi:transposase
MEPADAFASRKRKYAAAQISDDVKTAIARVYLATPKSTMRRVDFLETWRRAGYGFSKSQLHAWVARIDAGGAAVSTTKATGAEAALSREQRDIIGGWVLACNHDGTAVHLADYCRFASTRLGRQLSDRTASNYLADDGFSYRVSQSKAKGFVVDVEKQRTQLLQWVQAQRRDDVFDAPRDRLASIDFTFTGHRTERRSSFATTGGAQPASSSALSTYTNCIVTVLWADGKNRTPPLLFTFNPDFRRDRNRTARRDDLVARLNKYHERYGIDKSRVVYVGKAKGERRMYCSESASLVRRFFELYGVPQGSRVLSDQGNAFFEKGASVLLDLGFQKHVCYPPDVHQFLSPNDNRLHGTAKQSWRSSRLDYKDDVKSCLALLSLLDRDIVKHSATWFSRNMLALKEEDVEGLIGSCGKKHSHKHKAWLRAYRIWAGVDARGGVPDAPKGLDDSLDGGYWESG